MIQDDRYTLHNGDCLDVLKTLADSSVDAVVTDPPYGLAFMGKRWDYDVPSVEVWAECLRVLKPGGHLLAFAGTRTQHRMACRIEDGGFEIRDMIAWVYGSGFPKSLDVSKAIDKAAGAERCLVPASGGLHKNANLNDDGWNKIGQDSPTMWSGTPATEAAKQWSGWGTAVKPALEPITLARKPLIGTVAANVLEHGLGGINVDGCRVGANGATTRSHQAPYAEGGWRTGHCIESLDKDRWPANLIHDGSDEVTLLFPMTGKDKSAARFFYCAKASRSERGNGNNHPTVKPVNLMAYLCRLVTPRDGVVLDPFTGSGTTGVAAIREGFRFIGIEREEAYFNLSKSRVAAEVA